LRAIKPKISSTALFGKLIVCSTFAKESDIGTDFPNVEFSSAPTVEPVRSASSSVADEKRW
jgi:hypothetical protein